MAASGTTSEASGSKAWGRPGGQLPHFKKGREGEEEGNGLL